MSDNTPTAEASTPAFPGKIVALSSGNNFGVVALAECRFERIEGRTFLVGRNVHTAFPWNLPAGVTRAVAWDSTHPQHFILFDSREAFEQWDSRTADDGEVVGDDIPF